MSEKEVAILDRLLEPERPSLDPGVARAILTIEFQEADLARMNELAEKAREGKLTSEEQGELDSYERVGTFLSLFKSKARKSLRKSSGS
jgi:hypothetical protein